MNFDCVIAWRYGDTVPIRQNDTCVRRYGARDSRYGSSGKCECSPRCHGLFRTLVGLIHHKTTSGEEQKDCNVRDCTSAAARTA